MAVEVTLFDHEHNSTRVILDLKYYPPYVEVPVWKRPSMVTPLDVGYRTLRYRYIGYGAYLLEERYDGK